MKVKVGIGPTEVRALSKGRITDRSGFSYERFEYSDNERDLGEVHGGVWEGEISQA